MNRRYIPPRLLEHLQQPVTTTTRLIKIKLRTGFAYGLCMLDRDIDYDDGTGDGEITYVATNGFDPSTFAADVGFSVSNAEGYALISNTVPGVTEDMVNRGELDDATWVCYLVNFLDTTMGHVTLDAGDLGEVRTQYGMVWIPELLSYGMRLRQPVGGVWSRKCRAIFGSPKNSQTGCGVPLAPLWVPGEVTAVFAAEPDRVFTGDQVQASGGLIPQPGRVRFLTGDNAGREFAIETVDGLVVELVEPAVYAFGVGDEYEIRPDCAKRYLEDCIAKWNNGPNMKAEPLIPVGDASAIQSPGAQLPGGGGFGGGQSGNQVSEE
jgi:uncharacterized phage protein (TIGR02218 family)